MTRLTWDAVGLLTDNLARIIRESTYQPNLIVAVARGGFIPARLLSSRLKVNRMGSIGIAYEGSDRRTTHIYNVSAPINNTDSILIVEDALETGHSLAEACTILKRDAMIVRTAAYYFTPESIITPDYTVQMLSQVPEFPWE
jgi:uncharacterized protein